MNITFTTTAATTSRGARSCVTSACPSGTDHGKNRRYAPTDPQVAGASQEPMQAVRSLAGVPAASSSSAVSAFATWRCAVISPASSSRAGRCRMSMTDPIADFLSRIRNAIMARHAEVVAPASKLKVRSPSCSRPRATSPASTRATDDGMSSIVVRLRWADPRTNAITGLRRRSRPGQRMYVRHGHDSEDPLGSRHRDPVDVPRSHDRSGRPQGRRRRRAALRGLVNVMSRIGRKILPLPKGVTVSQQGRHGRRQGPEGRARQDPAGGDHLQDRRRQAHGRARRRLAREPREARPRCARTWPTWSRASPTAGRASWRSTASVTAPRSPATRSPWRSGTRTRWCSSCRRASAPRSTRTASS